MISLAERRAGLAADRDARRLAQTELERPVLVEAGAGTGKTTLLVARLLAWCLGPGWERTEHRLATGREVPPDAERVAAGTLERVAAITFTEAAAAEMAARVGRELAALAGGGELPSWLEPPRIAEPLFADPTLRERAQALLAALDHLTVATIHAWCLGLLSRHPLETGLHPHLRVDADRRLVAETVREVVEARLPEAYGERPDEDLLALAGRGIGPAEIAGAVETLVAAALPPEALEADPLGAGPVAELRRRLADAAGTLHAWIAPRLASGGRLDKAREVAGRVEDLEAAAAAEDAGRAGLGPLLAEAREIRDRIRARLYDWQRGRFTGAEARALGEVERELATAAGGLIHLLDHLQRLDPELLGHGFRALAPLLAEVRRELRSHGVITFQELLTETTALLARPEAAARERRRLDQLLVDEFQDTDHRQCEILHRLALEGVAGERPALFLVGDPKQSIYGWRSADLAAYEGFRDRVLAAEGLRCSLTQNFRSAPPILDEVARVVAPVMQARPGLQPPFEPLLACERLAAAPGFTGDGHAPVEHWISWRRQTGGAPALAATRSADANELEAESIARDLRRLHDRHAVPWPEMALLFRATTHLDTYLDALRRTGVPFVVRGDKQYYRRREIIEAAALVRSVLDPGDHLALVTLLRSSMVGVPDAALIPLWRYELPRRATELGRAPEALGRLLSELAEAVTAAAAELPRDVPGLAGLEGWETSLLAALEHLAWARLSFGRDPGDRFVETLRRLFLPEPVEAARYLGTYRLANLERFFRDLAAVMAEGEGDAAGLLRLLRTSVAESLEAEEGLPQQGAEDAVRVLTIHKAKGLEFDHVYLPQLHQGRRHGPRVDTEAAPWGGGFELRLFGAPTLGFDRVAAEREAVAAAERVRLLYVAMTRARQRLVLAGCWPGTPSPPPPEAASSLLDLVLSRPARPADPGELWAELEERGEASRMDAAGALWRLPELEEPGDGGAAAPVPTAAELAGPERVARDVELLGRRRREAAGRQGRPFDAAASEEAHDRLRELVADPERRSADPGPERSLRLAVGTAVHTLLERLDPAAEPAAELARLRPPLTADLARRLPAAELPRARALTEELLERLASGPLLARLGEIAGSILARELPVLVPAGDRSEGPVATFTGTLDLLYRDPATGELVVADYKTDQVETPDELTARAAAYAPQGEIYRRAVAEALGLSEPPRFELWFLHAGRILTARDG